jgi:hypothetical protein
MGAGYNDKLDVKAAELEAKLDTLNTAIAAIKDTAGIKKITDTVSVLLNGNSMELYGKSTDTKPTTGIVTGTTFLEIDTKTIYIWDGSSWVVF